jgi:predicted transposase/invertase (TIGR01784 family)
VATVTIENPYQFPLTTGGKISIIDISATDQLGRKFIVEMQIADKEGFVKRVQYYTARDYAMQIDSGEKYALLRPTHFIAVLNFDITEGQHYFSQHKIIDIATGEHLLQDMQFFFIELKKFNKAIDNLSNLIDKWTFFIKNAENLDVIPENVEDEGLKAAYIEADKHNWSKIELKGYDDAAIRDADIIQERIFAKKAGIAEGKIEGKIEGEAAKEAEMVIKLSKKGKSATEISDLLDISLVRVQAIIDDIAH